METTKWQRIRFTTGYAGYRMIRLGVELFLVPWFNILGLPISLAGSAFLVFCIADILVGMLFMYKPKFCFGTYMRAWTVFLSTACLNSLGFAALLNVTSVWAIYISAFITGASTGCWSTMVETATPVSFGANELGEVSQFIQVFESVGFLLPSIALAVLANVDLSYAQGVNDTNADEVAIRATAVVLAIVALFFQAISADQVVRAVATSPAGENTADTNSMIWDSLKQFFTTSIVAYFFFDSMILVTSNISMALMSIITTEYFGLSNANTLWIGALGFPVGAMVAIFFQMRFHSKTNKKKLAMNGTIGMILYSMLLIAISPLFPPSKESDSMAFLFLFGFGGGYFFSGTYASALTLWFTKLSTYSLSFNSQAAAINNIGVRAILAVVFQLQTFIIEFAMGDEASTSLDASLVCFLPLVIFLLIALAVTSKFIPYPKDEVFGWPGMVFFKPYARFIMSVVDSLGLLDMGDMAFAKFQKARYAFFSPHLKKSRVDRGPSVETGVTLNPMNFKKFLEDFNELKTSEQWWFSEANLDCLLPDPYVALETRLKILSDARESIRFITRTFATSNSGNQIADVLIQKASEGIDVKLIVDAVTLYYLDQESKLDIEGLPKKLEVLQRLLRGGVRVKMLNKWHKNEWSEYVIGTHRKFMLVDGKWLLTGGRNVTDEYFSTEGHHFMDSELVLNGNFYETTAAFFDKSLWDSAMDVAPLFPNLLLALEEKMDNDGSRKPRSSIFRSASIKIQENCNVSLFQLDHKSGDPRGRDIIFSSLLFMIETAKERIDLIFGYLQLFDELDAALTRAASRGIKIRVVTNSAESNDVPYMNGLFGPALERLLELGAEIHVCDKGENNLTLHQKVAIADGRAALIGSWNCLGTSVFYDSGYSVMLFDENVTAFESIWQEVEEMIKSGRLNRVAKVSGYDVHFFYKLFGPESIMKRGF